MNKNLAYSTLCYKPKRVECPNFPAQAIDKVIDLTYACALRHLSLQILSLIRSGLYALVEALVCIPFFLY